MLRLCWLVYSAAALTAPPPLWRPLLSPVTRCTLTPRQVLWRPFLSPVTRCTFTPRQVDVRACAVPDNEEEPDPPDAAMSENDKAVPGQEADASPRDGKPEATDAAIDAERILGLGPEDHDLVEYLRAGRTLLARRATILLPSDHPAHAECLLLIAEKMVKLGASVEVLTDASVAGSSDVPWSAQVPYPRCVARPTNLTNIGDLAGALMGTSALLVAGLPAAAAEALAAMRLKNPNMEGFLSAESTVLFSVAVVSHCGTLCFVANGVI